MIAVPRETYRDKRGRFISYWDAWQGPHQPSPMNAGGTVQKWRQAMAEDFRRDSIWLHLMGS